MAAVCGTSSDVPDCCFRLANLRTVRHPSFGHGDDAKNRYLPLGTNFTDTHPLLIDTEAAAEDIQSVAHQRIRAAADLLETFSCLTFEQADLKDISHITNALYLLVQDGCDLLEVAQTGMMRLTTTDAVKRTPSEQSQS
eukprot:gene2407-2737_t